MGWSQSPSCSTASTIAGLSADLRVGRCVESRADARTGSWNRTAAERSVCSAAGESWSVGADVIYNFHQDRNLFVDFVAGAHFDHHRVDNEVVR